MLGPLPVASLVGLQLLVLGGFLAWGGWRSGEVPRLVVGGILSILGLLLVIPLRRVPLGSHLVRRLAFLSRRRVGAGDAARTRVRAARDHTGQAFGLAELAPLVSAIVRVHPRGDAGIMVGSPPRLPLARIIERVSASGIPYDSLTVLSALGGGAEQAPTAALNEILIVMRVDPSLAHEAVRIRGGDAVGVDACVAALLGHVVSTVREAGLAAEVLHPDEASHRVSEALADAGHGDGSAWTEGWRELTTSSVCHRTLAVTALTPATDLSSLSAAFASSGTASGAVAVRMSPASAGAVRACVLMRVSDPQLSTVSAVTSALADTARGLGVRTTPVHGGHRSAYLGTTVVGSGPAPRGDRRVGSPVDAWLPVSSSHLDLLAPAVGVGGLLLGHTGTATSQGEPVSVSLVGPSARRVLAVGEGWLGASIAALAASQGVRVVVTTDHPAPWTVLSRQHTLQDRLLIVPVGSSSWTMDEPTLVVTESAAAERRVVRRPWQSTLLVSSVVDQLDAGVVASSALVVLTRSALAAADQAGTLLGLSDHDLAQALAGGHDVLVTHGGRIEPVTLHPIATP